MDFSSLLVSQVSVVMLVKLVLAVVMLDQAVALGPSLLSLR